MTPTTRKDYTYPASLKRELEENFGVYIPDVTFRTQDREELLKGIYTMTNQHFDMIEYLVRHKEWDFFMFVEIGLDRIHHAFWKYFDSSHHLYVKGNKYENVIIDYYRFLDERVARLLKFLGKDTVATVVSDHGVKAMKGAFCINKWMAEKGYLVINTKPSKACDIMEADVDWAKTKAWAWGGYYARIFLNIKGRERHGSILPFRYEAWRDKLKREISAIKGPDGQDWNTKVYKPQEIYKETKGDFPDLMAYIDDLSWRSAGTIGHESMYLSENDMGPDDAMHDWNGVFIMYDPSKEGKGDIGTVGMLDFAPTVLELMGVEVPSDMQGKSILKDTSSTLAHH